MGAIFYGRFHREKGELLKRLVAITTIRQGDANNAIERVRSEVFFDTLTELNRRRIALVSVYTECSDSYLHELEKRGVVLIAQQGSGVGNVRRQALASTLRLFPFASYFLWLEPEKPGLPRFATSLVTLMEEHEADLGLFNRISLSSYPREQAYYYLFCRAVASRLIESDVDYAFGPMILTRQGMLPFLSYAGEYGDLWEATLLPRLRVIKAGMTVAILCVPFKNDPRMTRAESGNPAMIEKRVRQLSNVVPSLLAEWAGTQNPKDRPL